MSTLANRIAAVWDRVQMRLFPAFEAANLTLTPQLQNLVRIFELLRVEEGVVHRCHSCPGVKPRDRGLLLRAFVARAFYSEAQTKAWRERLLTDHDVRRVIGWDGPGDVPSEATFSRAFREFAEWDVLGELHAQRVTEAYQDDYCWMGVLDSTAIHAREAPIKKEKSKKRPPSRLEYQSAQVPEIALLDLPTACDVGCKPNSQGRREFWHGYKTHLVVNEDGVPLAAITTSASLHDNQAAIPLLTIAARRVRTLYSLMDSAYDARLLLDYVEGDLAQVPIVERQRFNARTAMPWSAFQVDLFKRRTVIERANSRLKDGFAVDNARVQGHRKIHAHVMLGVILLFAETLLRLLA